MLSVSARLVATATRVLAAGDEQLIEAVELALVSVSDAAAIVDLPKEAQREAVTQVRAGRARTLREAVKLSLTGGPTAADGAPAPHAGSDDATPVVSVRRLRRACQRFTTGHSKLCRDIDSAALACGGPNDHTRRAHASLAAALDAIKACLQEFGRRQRPK